MGLQKQYSDVQIFTLIYLTSEEQKQEEMGLAFGQPNPREMPIGFRYVTSIRDLSLKMPPSSIRYQGSGKEIFTNIKDEIDKLVNEELLKIDPNLSSNRGPQDQAFYVTAEGILFIRRNYQGLIAIIENKKRYEKLIDRIEVDSNSKKYLKKLRDKLLNQTEDKIINIILSEIVQKGQEYGPTLFKFLIGLVNQNSNTSWFDQ